MIIRILMLASVVFSLAIVGVGQKTPAPPPPPPPPQPQPQPRQPTILIPRGPRFPRQVERDPGEVIVQRQAVLRNYTSKIYRKPTSKELATIEPPPSVLQRFAAFLTTPNTGITRFSANSGCSTSRFVLDVSKPCRAYTMPGSGASFSFRTKSYQLRQLADLTVDGGTLLAGGEFSHGMIMDMAKLPIEDVSLDSKLVKHLAAFKGASNVDGARNLERMLRSGISVDKHMYGRSAQVSLDATYLIRVIAYRGSVPRAAFGIEYDELDFDKRRDVIAVFRVVDVALDGSVTILWKMLSNQPAPYLKDDRKVIREWVREFDISVSKVGEPAERTLGRPQ